MTVSVEAVDEISNYLNAQYLLASEAMWRIFQFEITQKTPAVVSLNIHLPGTNLHQMYRTNQPSSQGTELLRYFHWPIDPIFDNLKFSEYYSQYRQEKYTTGIEIPAGSWLEKPSTQFPWMIIKTRVHGDIIICM